MSSNRIPLSRLAACLAVLVLAATTTRADTPKPEKYPFTAPPVELVDRFAKAELGTADPFGGDERARLEAVWKARIDPKAQLVQADESAVHAHLLASGVTDPAKRFEYVKKFDALVSEAKEATAGAKNDPEKADRLLRFLHKGVMAKGYVADQTTLSGVFDTGTYNCVSSSCLYFLVGTRLGLTLQPILIPGGFVAGHAAIDLVDGKKRIQVEPTNPDGFDWETKVNRPGVVVLGFVPDRKQAHDTDGFGLAASIASNRGVGLVESKPPRPAEAIRCYALALTLNPADRSAANNLAAAFSNWGVGLSGDNKFEDAVRAFGFGESVLGPAGELDHNHRIVWTQYLDAEFDAGRYAEGLKLRERVAAALPKAEDFQTKAGWFTRAAQRRTKDSWPAAMAVADEGLMRLTGDEAKVIAGWKADGYRQWSQELLEKGDVARSLKVLAGALADDPKNETLLAGLGYHAQEALGRLEKDKGLTAAIAHFKELREKFPKHAAIAEAGAGHAFRAIDGLADDKKFAEAVRAAAEYKPLAEDRADDLLATSYHQWVRALAKEKKWKEAMGKYAEGLKALPKNDRLLPLRRHSWWTPGAGDADRN